MCADEWQPPDADAPRRAATPSMRSALSAGDDAQVRRWLGQAAAVSMPDAVFDAIRSAISIEVQLRREDPARDIAGDSVREPSVGEVANLPSTYDKLGVGILEPDDC